MQVVKFSFFLALIFFSGSSNAACEFKVATVQALTRPVLDLLGALTPVLDIPATLPIPPVPLVPVLIPVGVPGIVPSILPPLLLKKEVQSLDGTYLFGVQALLPIDVLGLLDVLMPDAVSLDSLRVGVVEGAAGTGPNLKIQNTVDLLKNEDCNIVYGSSSMIVESSGALFAVPGALFQGPVTILDGIISGESVRGDASAASFNDAFGGFRFSSPITLNGLNNKLLKAKFQLSGSNPFSFATGHANKLYVENSTLSFNPASIFTVTSGNAISLNGTLLKLSTSKAMDILSSGTVTLAGRNSLDSSVVTTSIVDLSNNALLDLSEGASLVTEFVSESFSLTSKAGAKVKAALNSVIDLNQGDMNNTNSQWNTKGLIKGKRFISQSGETTVEAGGHLNVAENIDLNDSTTTIENSGKCTADSVSAKASTIKVNGILNVANAVDIDALSKLTINTVTTTTIGSLSVTGESLAEIQSSLTTSFVQLTESELNQVIGTTMTLASQYISASSNTSIAGQLNALNMTVTAGKLLIPSSGIATLTANALFLASSGNISGAFSAIGMTIGSATDLVVEAGGEVVATTFKVVEASTATIRGTLQAAQSIVLSTGNFLIDTTGNVVTKLLEQTTDVVTTVVGQLIVEDTLTLIDGTLTIVANANVKVGILELHGGSLIVQGILTVDTLNVKGGELKVQGGILNVNLLNIEGGSVEIIGLLSTNTTIQKASTILIAAGGRLVAAVELIQEVGATITVNAGFATITLTPDNELTAGLAAVTATIRGTLTATAGVFIRTAAILDVSGTISSITNGGKLIFSTNKASPTVVNGDVVTQENSTTTGNVNTTKEGEQTKFENSGTLGSDDETEETHVETDNFRNAKEGKVQTVVTRKSKPPTEPISPPTAPAPFQKPPTTPIPVEPPVAEPVEPPVAAPVEPPVAEPVQSPAQEEPLEGSLTVKARYTAEFDGTLSLIVKTGIFENDQLDGIVVYDVRSGEFQDVQVSGTDGDCPATPVYGSHSLGMLFDVSCSVAEPNPDGTPASPSNPSTSPTSSIFDNGVLSTNELIGVIVGAVAFVLIVLGILAVTVKPIRKKILPFAERDRIEKKKKLNSLHLSSSKDALVNPEGSEGGSGDSPGRNV